MRGRRPGRKLRRLGVVLWLAAFLSAVAPAAPVAAASDRLPDLRADKITDLRIVRTSSGRKLLKFTTVLLNYGAGPFEVRGTRPHTNTPFDIDQIVYRTDGTIRRIETDAQFAYAGDGHDHYHVKKMASYHLWSNRGTLRDSKIGFCFFDTSPRYLSLPGAPSSARYRESGCGSRRSTTTRTGISVGWGDKYPWNFAYQWIDITGLPAGTYTLRSAVDLFSLFRESRETNNCFYVRLSVGSSSVRVLGGAATCVNDYDSTAYASDARWGLGAGMAAGCDPLLFCTYNVTRRDELAVFLSRLLRLPATNQDLFTDDEGSRFEAYHNRVGVAGIMTGCGGGKFCPTSLVTRQFLAVTLSRALELPASETDHFTDDDGIGAEASFNSVADAGLIDPCAENRICPTRTVVRGEIARILRRGFGS
jgi:Lysyl oxidase